MRGAFTRTAKLLYRENAKGEYTLVKGESQRAVGLWVCPIFLVADASPCVSGGMGMPPFLWAYGLTQAERNRKRSRRHQSLDLALCQRTIVHPPLVKLAIKVLDNTPVLHVSTQYKGR